MSRREIQGQILREDESNFGHVVVRLYRTIK